MIRTTTLLTLFIFSFLYGSAQTYTVTYDTSDFDQISPFYAVDKSNPTLYNGIKMYKSIPIGFQFEMDGIFFDSLEVAENGFVRFKSGQVNQAYISAFECPLEDRPSGTGTDASPIVYNTFGTPGDRIFKLYFVNAGFDFDGEDNDYIEFQLWMYESCGDFEIHVGYQSIEPSEYDIFYNQDPAPVMGFGNYVTQNHFTLDGGYSLPSISNTFTTLSSVPPTYSLYRFSKCGVNSVVDKETVKLKVFPNPTSDYLNVDFSENLSNPSYAIIDVQGKVISEGLLSTDNIDVSMIPNGSYIVHIFSSQHVYQTKFIKQ